MLFTSLAVLVAGATSVRAHGYVQSVNIAGQTYPGWLPFSDPYIQPNPQTVVRKVADDGPITFDSGDLTCNKGGAVGNGETATVAAGQSVTWTMNTWPADHKGPVTVYMANCGDSCDSFDGSGNKWYKLSSEGLIDAPKFYWASDKLISQGNSWTQTIPSNIMPGNYLMRLEILALHSAGSPQFYPSCTQLKVTGGGDGAPGESELVSIPGVYKSGDPALFGSIWEQPQSWPQVGPNVAAFVNGGSAPAPAPAPTTSDPEPSSSKPAPSSTYSEPESYPSPTKGPLPTAPVATTKTKVCRIKRSQKNHFAKREYLRGWGKKRL
ncbi:glycoside hydrolase family 61 protein [Rhizoctonia solani]|uniref:lytic cellulose monooxygenase (C4-dehydrogenating) n=1 Tax=Rhizoctonia solani TaxID=456999 RepID=A0A8H8P051_9AGAM|nr:glycoside hydrolase family 61 protein [Rhizoctonia solani]QRW22113.1 glycoside hydrolase family 61 protein [Rhizoctonia solani]